MKSIKYLLGIAIQIMIFSCTSNDTMLTKVNSDGTITREFEAETDSAFMVGDTAKSNPFMIDIDSSWQVTWNYNNSGIRHDWPLKSWISDTICKRDSVIHPKTNIKTDTIKCSQKPVKVKVSRTYTSAEDLEKTFQLSHKNKWHNIRPSCRLEKKFRWFYSYYMYYETYPKIKTLDRVPLEKYMSKQEAEYWFNGTSDFAKGMNGIELKDELSKLEDKFNLWFGQNVWEMQYEILLDNYDSISNIKVSKERLSAAKDSIFEKYKDKIKFLEDFDVAQSLDEFFKTKAFTQHKDNVNNVFKKFDNNMDSQEYMKYFESNIEYKLVMPGNLLSYGNALNHGDTLTWNLTAYRMVYSNFEIKATSRKTNNWAFWVTGIIVLLAIGSYFVKKR